MIYIKYTNYSDLTCIIRSEIDYKIREDRE